MSGSEQLLDFVMANCPGVAGAISWALIIGIRLPTKSTQNENAANSSPAQTVTYRRRHGWHFDAKKVMNGLALLTALRIKNLGVRTASMTH
jgi:hypothetical protein